MDHKNTKNACKNRTQSKLIGASRTQSDQKWPALALAALLFASNLQLATAATVSVTLVDIGLQPLNTKVVITPTNEVQVSGAGLNAGPAMVVGTTNGLFSVLLDTGDYAVSLPLVPGRRPFMISVADTNGTIALTNIISAIPPVSTNNPNYTVKATAGDNGPAILNSKILVAGSLQKLLSTNSGAVSITLSNSATALALANDNVQIGVDGVCTFAAQGTPFTISATGAFSRMQVGDGSEHLLNADGSFLLANGGVSADTLGNLAASSFTTTGDIEITDSTRGVILKSPGGTRYRLKVADDGTLSTETVP